MITDGVFSVAQQRLLGFSEFCRANGLAVDTSIQLDLQRLVGLGYLDSRTRFKYSARSCICRSQKDWRQFDTLFDAYWQADGEPLPADAVDELSSPDSGLSVAGEQRLLGMAGTSEKQRQEEEFFGAGDFKALSLADFRFVFNASEMRAIECMVDRAARRAKKRVTRREVIANSGTRIDLRSASRKALKYGGKLVELKYKKRKPRPKRFVLLLDVSQSMDVYARLFLRFTRILMCLFQRSHAFVFNTDLHELGRGHAKLTEDEFERVLNRLGKGWLGGTKIALSLDVFINQHMKHCVDNNTTLLIFSDGCDTATPGELAERVEVLQRRAGKLIWVNPLLGRFKPGEADRYMDPVVPYVDRYMSAHNLNSLLKLEKELIA